MALTRAKKAQKVEALAKELQGSTSAIVGTFTKMTVSQDFELRQKVRDAGGRYRVLKNKLASRAAEGTEIATALQGLKGVSSVAYTSGDPVALAKALSAWVKDNAQFTFKLGIVDGKVINVQEVQALATLPGKDELFAKLLFLINAPAQRLVTVMGATGRDLAVVVNQGVEKEKFAKGAEAAQAPVASAAAGTVTPAAAAPDAPLASSEVAVDGILADPVAADAVDAPAASAEALADAPSAELEPEKQAEAAADEAPAEGEAV